MAGSKSGAEMKKCPTCNCELKSKNYSAHMKRVHNVTSLGASEDRVGSRKGKRAETRKLELSRKKKKRYISIAASMLLVVLAGTALYFTSGNETPGPSPLQSPPPQAESAVKIPVSQLSASALFYEYNSGATAVRYFGAIGSDGNVHVATDACDVCYAEKKGYRQVGDVMKCNNCGKEFPINKVGTENLSGGCWPSYLPLTISEGNAVIQFSDLKAKSFMFS